MKNERYFKKINHKKIANLCLKITVFLVCIPFLMGAYYESDLIYKLNNITLEIGDILSKDINDYITMISNNPNLHIETNAPLDEENHLTNLGEYNYYLVYNDTTLKYSKKTNITATLTVVDTVKPSITLLEKKEFTYGSNILASDIASCSDLSGCELYFEEEINTSESGNKIVNIVAVDGGHNKNYISTEITILEKPVSAYYYNYDYMNIHNNQINNTLTEEEKNNLRNEIVSFAKQFIGNPYVYGGTSLTNGTDCSGFTMSIYANFGYLLPRVATHQASTGLNISYNDLLPGDLIVYFYQDGGGHVGIYAGNGMMIHAATPERGIVYEHIFEGYKIYKRIIY